MWLKRLEEQRQARIAIRPTLAGRRQTAFGLRAGPAVTVLIGIVAWCHPAVAAVCRVPAAVLCEGCVERLSIRVAAGGGCRISFTSAPSAEQTGTAKFVDIDVEAEPQRSALHRVSARHAVPLRPSPGCFIFNSRRFCE